VSDEPTAANEKPGRPGRHTLKRFAGLLSGRPGLVALIVTTSLFIAGASLLDPWMRKLAVDHGMLAGDRAYLVRIVLILLGLHLAQTAGSYFQAGAVNWLGQSALNRLRIETFSHLQRLSLDYHERQEPGKLISRIINDLEAINELISTGLTTLIQAPLVLVGTSVILFTLFDWRLAALLHLLIPVLLLVVVLFRKVIYQAFARTRETLAAVTEHLHQSVAGIRVIKALAHELRSQQRFAELNEADFRANVYAGGVFAFFFPVIEILMGSGLCIILWYGGLRAVAGTVTAGDILAIIGYLFRIFEPMQQLAELSNSVQRGLVALDRMQSILDQVPSVQDAPDAVPLPPVSKEITFRDLDFAYDGRHFILHGVNLDVRFGETVAFVGPTGAGKSSLMKLLSRMYDPQRGEIRIDGHDIRRVTLHSLRRQMGIVLQESFLFAGTIRDNIRYGRPEATDEEVVAAAALANADHFIRELPEGYDTDVHERGVKLSAGQRQLVAFARALLVQPRILILDEATSSVDPFTELHVQEALERLLRDRISFVVAHRLSTIVHADKICVILNGGIAAQGRHDELLHTSPLYASLYHRRFLPGEAEAPVEVAT
jgi:ABC-type multidrug transport system fused ATPase/permease subunit